MNTAFCSIIIPMYNSENYIKKCIESVLSVDYDVTSYEVILVDNMSTDNSVLIASAYPVKIITSSSKTIAGVRNDGAKVASGRVLAFVDSDCMVPAHWLKTGVELLAAEKIGIVGSGYKIPDDAEWIEKAWLYEAENVERVVKFIPSGNMLVRSDLFKKVNGFNAGLVTCEDADLCERIVSLGYKVLNSSQLQSVHLRNPKTITEFVNKEQWYGLNMMISIANGNFDKVFCFTVLFYASHVILLLGIYYTELIWIAVLAILALINTAVIYRLSISKKYKQYFALLILYYSYFAARGAGMIKYLIDREKSSI